MASPAGILFVMTAPSGTGKSTLARRLVEATAGLEFSVSYTTRAPRAGEADGRDYHFVGRDRFEAMVAAGEFLEWAPVFGNLYGTAVEATRRGLDLGRLLLLDIDVEGAKQVRKSGESCVSIMVLPPDYRTLRDRLCGRGSESDAQLAGRLARARREAEDFPLFDYLVVNDDLDRAVGKLAAIVEAERSRTAQCAARAHEILDTFPA